MGGVDFVELCTNPLSMVRHSFSQQSVGYWQLTADNLSRNCPQPKRTAAYETVFMPACSLLPISLQCRNGKGDYKDPLPLSPCKTPLKCHHWSRLLREIAWGLCGNYMADQLLSLPHPALFTSLQVSFLSPPPWIPSCTWLFQSLNIYFPGKQA